MAAGPGRPDARRAGPRLLVVEHGRHAPAGLLADWAAARSLRMQTVALHAGEALPDAPGCDAAVILGSELTAYDDTLPWLAGELAFIERMLAASVPVLGICFGAQALARVLGARLYRLPEPEIGWAKVASERAGLAAGPWLSWHRDAFDLPAGTAQIAANEVCVQGFCYGPHAGLQFHPEATQAIAASWLRFADPPPGEEVTGALFRDADGAWDRAAAHASAVFSAWLDGGLTGP
jgi:GMP synthase-like glutamine amidotransferase